MWKRKEVKVPVVMIEDPNEETIGEATYVEHGDHYDQEDITLNPTEALKAVSRVIKQSGRDYATGSTQYNDGHKKIDWEKGKTTSTTYWKFKGTAKYKLND